jgi:hypothetical protein
MPTYEEKEAQTVKQKSEYFKIVDYSTQKPTTWIQKQKCHKFFYGAPSTIPPS